jgi:hypothetical protein
MAERQREVMEIAALRFGEECCDLGGVKGLLRPGGILPTASEPC